MQWTGTPMLFGKLTRCSRRRLLRTDMTELRKSPPSTERNSSRTVQASWRPNHWVCFPGRPPTQYTRSCWKAWSSQRPGKCCHRYLKQRDKPSNKCVIYTSRGHHWSPHCSEVLVTELSFHFAPPAFEVELHRTVLFHSESHTSEEVHQSISLSNHHSIPLNKKCDTSWNSYK